MLLRLFLLLCLCVPGLVAGGLLDNSSTGGPGLLQGSASQTNFLQVNDAFRPGVVGLSEQEIRVRFEIVPEYYLYRHRLGFKLTGDGASVTDVSLPAGQNRHDEFFGDVEVYYDRLEIALVFEGSLTPQQQLQVDFQGCADAGLCYPPETVILPLPGSSPAASGEADARADAPPTQGATLALLLFFLAGLGLTFTPCVLPMLPILSSLVVGRADIDRMRAVVLALSYVLGMALTFAAVGALIGLFGAAMNIQARLQSPWVLGTFAVFFVIFALAMFGLFDLRLPAFLREPLERLGSRTRGGSIPGAAVMGALSTLVVSPCISAPLAGALVYISTTGDAGGGALRLFALALGMGAPLLLVAVFGNALLPRSGPWLDTVKQLFGFGLLGVAIWLLERLLPGPISLALWAVLAAGLAVQLGLFERASQSVASKLARIVALLAAIYAAVSLAGALAGGSDPLRPLAPLTTAGQARTASSEGFFTVVGSQAGIDAQLARASELSRPAVIELYADWCISCKVIERRVLRDETVRGQLEDFVRIKLDLTDNTADQRQWLTDKGLFGPPAFLFYSREGSEIAGLRIQGEIDRDGFLQRLASVPDK
ncbi:protein-disulfide reductase DsbD [Halopseudomonas sp.]|uniref:protein-disulfide reductase DsbD n=1 Tax=Halopseudomonas sp. TaxID=2901191 RepID=UPI003564A2DB